MKKRLLFVVILCSAMLLTACRNGTESSPNDHAVTESETDSSTDSAVDNEAETGEKEKAEEHASGVHDTEDEAANGNADSDAQHHTENSDQPEEPIISSPEQIIWDEEASLSDQEDVITPDAETKPNDHADSSEAQEETNPTVTEKVIELPFVPAD